MKPAAMLLKVPCKANPTARPAVPRTARMLAVCTPNCASTATTTTTSTR